MNCPHCNATVLDIDVKCSKCGAALGSSGAHRMIGQVVLGVYELADVLGQGGMSVVFKGRHKMTEQEVALKILPPELAAHSQVKSRFLDEAKALAALDHPNIVHLYNFGQENGSFVLAMQFVQGRTWERLILENKRLDWTVSCRIAVDVLKALEYAHGRGVIHRDMKPSNVLVRAHDGSATVMDFGIAKMTTSTKLTATGQTMGTVRYMSPEQVRGQEVDLRTDLYSLGATLYESLVGDTPFDGETHFEIMTKHLSEAPKRPSTLGIKLPGEVEDALMRSLAKRAGDRFESARDMRKVIEAALKDGDVALSETQKLGRDALGDLVDRSSASRRAGAFAETPRGDAATASELADQLEPGGSTVRGKRPPPKKWPWLVAALVVLAGGATAAALLLGGQAHPPDTKQAGSAELVFEPGGGATSAQGGAAYRASLEALAKVVAAKLPHVSLERPVDRIVLVPQADLCDPARYGDIPVPASCKGLVSSVSTSTPRTLLVVADQPPLQHAMDDGVATAVCLFQAFAVDGDPESPQKAKLANEICDVATKQFLKDR